MSKKSDRFYFENFIQASQHSCEAAKYLTECLNDFNPENLKQMLETMHEIENQGDKKRHEISAALAKAFVTPLEREDLALISHRIDDVTDKIEEILQCFYKDNVTSVLPEAIEFAKKLETCCILEKKIMQEFANFKKPAKIHDMVIELSHIEEECDKLYLKAMRNIRKHCTDVLDIISWREIYDCMEECADACEGVGDSIETVIMKNT